MDFIGLDDTRFTRGVFVHGIYASNSNVMLDMLSSDHLLTYLHQSEYLRTVEECLVLIRDCPDRKEALFDLLGVLGPIIGCNW